MASLDGFLNIAIPIGIIIFFCGIMYGKLKDQLDPLFIWIKNAIFSGKDKVQEQLLTRPEIVYD